MKSQSESIFQIAILAEPSNRFADLIQAQGIEWLRCAQTGKDTFEFYKEDALLASVNLSRPHFNLSSLTGIIVVCQPDRLDAVTNAWRSGLPSFPVGFRSIPVFEPAAVLRAALECMAEELSLQRRHSGRAALELAGYRREFERLQNCFTRLEAYTARHSLQNTAEIFDYPVGTCAVRKQIRPGQIGEVEAGSGRYLTQYVPVDSFGVSGFAIYVAARPDTPAETLRVTLKAVETDQIWGDWVIRSGDVSIGWVELALERAIDESALSLVIAVEWPAENNGWAVLLGPRYPYKEASARAESGEYLPAPLAMRVFAGLPGVHVPATTSAIQPGSAPYALTKFIPYDAYTAVEQVFPRPHPEKTGLVAYDRNLGCITVHPRNGGLITAGRMKIAMPTGAWRVSAQIHLGHERASLTHFALLIGTAEESDFHPESLIGNALSAQGFSGWKSLSPLEKGRISATTDQPLNGEAWLFLLTRQDPASSPDFGWARFADLQINILPVSFFREDRNGSEESQAWPESGAEAFAPSQMK